MKPRPRATLSFDLDTAADHLQGYGHGVAEPEEEDPVYRLALPRILDSLDGAGLKATFFVIARDAETQAERLQEVARRGHEIASHSWSHSQPFVSGPEERLEAELTESRTALESASGSEVVGFRAPGWDLRPPVLERLGQAGYEYDASVFPGPFLPLLRLATWWLGTRSPAIFRMATFRHVFARRHFHLRKLSTGRTLVEFPLTLTPILGWPLYRTMESYLGASRLERCVCFAARLGRDLSFPGHGMDFLGIDEDGVDERLRRHPGMGSPLAERLEHWKQWMDTMAPRFRFATFREHARELASPRPSPELSHGMA
ncbi:MAG: polysaccharide deacetylase family protein [Planctomycetota bacterium]